MISIHSGRKHDNIGNIAMTSGLAWIFTTPERTTSNNQNLNLTIIDILETWKYETLPNYGRKADYFEPVLPTNSMVVRKTEKYVM